MVLTSYLGRISFTIFILLQSGKSAEVKDTVIAVEGGIAHLPCDIRPPNSDEQVYLVLWYRYDEGEPLYSYDARSSSKLTGRRWSDERGFGARAYFDVDTSPAILKIENVRQEEAQSYRCRVDFKSAPTRNSLINLTIIVPPSKVEIFDSRNNLLQSLAGPYELESTVVLRCLSTGGYPSPEVIWRKNGVPIDSSYEKMSVYQMQNNLTLYRVSKDDLGQTYSCEARNNNISHPVSTSISLDLLFRPNNVHILNSKDPLSSSKIYQIKCTSSGSRPSATITWWKNHDFLGRTETWEVDNNTSMSSLTFSAKPSDNGKHLTCRSENTQLKNSAIEDVWKLSVYYIPEISLNFGASLDPNNIAEGNDVYFECNISSNPPVYKIVWKHNNNEVQHDKSKGIIISGTSLVLQEVKRNSSGTYTCTASNTEGDVKSNSVFLKVMYRPICNYKYVKDTGIGKDRQAHVTCNVHSHPPPIDFFWTFNTSDRFIVIEGNNFTSNSTHSRLTYIPPDEIDYGKLYCWAVNKIGRMKTPCVFQIIPAGPPDPPTNCSVVNQTTESLEVKCQPGFDGGSTQNFLLHVTDIETGESLANSSNNLPEFQISGLHSGRGLLITIYSKNANGKSLLPVVIEGFTLKIAQLQLESAGEILSPTLGILVGTLATLFLVALVIILVIRSKTKRQSSQISSSSPMNGKDEETFKTTFDDSNPDVVPAANEDMVEISVTQNGTSKVVNRSSPPYLPTNRLDPSTVKRDSSQQVYNYGSKESPTSSSSLYGNSHPSSWTPLLKSRRAQESVL